MEKIPVVAIVGRPNVGKSTIFNRIAGKRIAVVSSVPGVTRDRVSIDTFWNDKRFFLVDTGGITDDQEAVLVSSILEQTKCALDEADFVIQVVDITCGILKDDWEAAKVVRSYKKPTVVAANKADNQKLEQNASDFYKLGFDTVLPVSAIHGQGVASILEHLFEKVPISDTEDTYKDKFTISIVGRPNVGKSALFNRVINSERSIVSDIPGTTHDAIDMELKYDDNDLVFIDTAGIRKRGKLERKVEKFSVLRALGAIERSLVCALVTDTSELATAQDTHIAGYVASALRGVVVVVSKWDLAKEYGLSKELALEKIREVFKFLPSPEVVFTSALNGEGVDSFLKSLVTTHTNYQKEVDKTQLNSCIAYAIGENPPPRRQGRAPTIFSVKQDNIAPPVFVFDSKRAEHLHFSYKRYLEGCIRKNFDFKGVPMVLRFKTFK